MRPSHAYNHFFSSLKQVEKRLKIDDRNPNPPSKTSQSNSPIYFNTNENTSSSTSTETPPQEFLSNTSINNLDDFPHKNPPQLQADDIDSLMQLLGLSDFDVDGKQGQGWEMSDYGDDEFYENIVKVKGPKCKKEVERLDGWIKHLLNDRSEALRLAHLILAKAAFVSDDYRGLQFPSTVDEFLQNDPPLD